MSANVPVTVFNTNGLAAQVAVNNGPPFEIWGANSSDWVPQTPAAGGPSWSNVAPAPNVLAPGENHLSITPSGSIQPFDAIVTLPATMQMIALQIYILFNSYGDVTWIALNNGQFITGNMGSASRG